MKKISLLSFVLFFTVFACHAGAADHRIGGGINYWVAVDDIDVDDIDENGFSYLISYQYWPALLGVELDLEIMPDRYGETAFAPQAFLLLGSTIYGGAGIGIEYRDSSFADRPFFAFRAGLNLELLPGIYTDFYGIYRFNEKADLDKKDTKIDSDTIFLGAAVRIGF